MGALPENFFSSLVWRVNDDFRQNGFTLGSQYLEALEQVRARTQPERDYVFYLGEVLAETHKMSYPWTPAARRGLSPSERSGYLDFLAKEFDCDSGTLDPNMAMLVKSSVQERINNLEHFRALKKVERERFGFDLNSCPSGASISVAERLTAIASSLDFSKVANRLQRNKVLSFRGGENAAGGVTLRLPDLQSVLSRGFVLVQYQIDLFAEERFGIDQFIPGGYLYPEWNKDEPGLCFSFYAQCRFAMILANAIGELISG